MTKTETVQLMAIIRQVYPRYYDKMSTDELRATVNLWHEMFVEDGGTEVFAAVRAFIATDTEGFPPSIGQIKQRLVRLKAPDMPDESSAWAQVWRAVQNSAYNAEREFEKLHPVVRRVVGNPAMLRAWSQLPPDEVQTVVASNFQRAYRGRAADAAERLALPQEIRKYLEAADPTERIPALPDPESQKRQAIALLQAERDEQARRILGDC